jgi:GH35 family endo-1,4-beta-xylanase
MLTVRVKGSNGESVPRDEIVTLFASDLMYEPFRRMNTVSQDGTVEIKYPGEPVMLHAKITVPGYGYMWIITDNCGAGYKDGAVIDFTADAAVSRVLEVEKVIRSGGFTPSVKCLSLLNDAKILIKQAAGSVNAPELNLTALANGLLAGEIAVVDRARNRIAKNPRRDNFLFGCATKDLTLKIGDKQEWTGAFNYPYEKFPALKEVYDSLFNYATLPFYLARLEREKDKPQYDDLDKLQDALEKSNIKTKGHPLWWAHNSGMPPWARELKWEDGGIQREIKRVCQRSVKRYKGRINYYDVINEAHDWCNAYMLTQEQEAEMTKLCCDAVHEAAPEVNAVINTCFMFGENVADGRVQWGIEYERLMTPYSYLKRVEALDTQYETIGIQLYRPSRDMLELDKLYDRYSVFGKPLHLTELGVPSHFKDVPYQTLDMRLYCLRFMYNGLWREMDWSERLQADWLEEFYTISYARPEVEALTWWSISDSPSYIPGAGLVRADGTPKEAAFRLKELEKSWGINLGK